MTPLEITVLSFYIIQNLTYQKSFEVKKNDNKPEHDSNAHYQANNQYISYAGRIDLSNPQKSKFQTPMTYIEKKYFGISGIVLFNNNHLWKKIHNYLEFIIDDAIQSSILIADKEDKNIFIEDLSLGHHIVLLYKDTELVIGNIELLGFEVQKLFPPGKKTQCKIEIKNDGTQDSLRFCEVFIHIIDIIRSYNIGCEGHSDKKEHTLITSAPVL